MNPKIEHLKQRIRYMLVFFMVALVISGATAIPVEAELNAFLAWFPSNNDLSRLLTTVLNAVRDTQAKYPFLLYGYDWLAFAHFVIAVAFIGPFMNPVRNIWVIQFGLIACAMVIPFAFIFSAIRGLPFWWSLIDCSFGVFGALPLWYCYRQIKKLEGFMRHDGHNIVF